MAGGKKGASDQPVTTSRTKRCSWEWRGSDRRWQQEASNGVYLRLGRASKLLPEQWNSGSLVKVTNLPLPAHRHLQRDAFLSDLISESSSEQLIESQCAV